MAAVARLRIPVFDVGQVPRFWMLLITEDVQIDPQPLCSLHAQSELGDLVHGVISAYGEVAALSRRVRHCRSEHANPFALATAWLGQPPPGGWLPPQARCVKAR